MHAYCRLAASARELYNLRLGGVKGNGVVSGPLEKMVDLALCSSSRLGDGRPKPEDSDVIGVAKP